MEMLDLYFILIFCLAQFYQGRMIREGINKKKLDFLGEMSPESTFFPFLDISLEHFSEHAIFYILTEKSTDRGFNWVLFRPPY